MEPGAPSTIALPFVGTAVNGARKSTNWEEPMNQFVVAMLLLTVMLQLVVLLGMIRLLSRMLRR
jgi:hypothetical protein